MTPAEALAKALFDASGEPMTNWMMGAANREKHSRHADRILAALAAAGFVVVPVVATEEMISAACANGVTMPNGGEMPSTVVPIWQTMLAARRR